MTSKTVLKITRGSATAAVKFTDDGIAAIAIVGIYSSVTARISALAHAVAIERGARAIVFKLDSAVIACTADEIAALLKEMRDITLLQKVTFVMKNGDYETNGTVNTTKDVTVLGEWTERCPSMYQTVAYETGVGIPGGTQDPMERIWIRDCFG